MTLKLTSEQRAIVRSATGGQPITVTDEESREVYWLVSPSDFPAAWRDYVRDLVQQGLDAAERGEIVEWDPDEMRRIARGASAKAREG